MTYDLTDLQLFLQVVDQGSITGGADRSHLSLASASARIKAMEMALGAPLLIRHRRGVVPSPAGWLLVSHAREVVGQIARMRAMWREIAMRLLGIEGEMRTGGREAVRGTAVAGGVDVDAMRARRQALQIVLDEDAVIGRAERRGAAGAAALQRYGRDRSGFGGSKRGMRKKNCTNKGGCDY